MHYLIERMIKDEKVNIVGNCLNPIHRGVVVGNYATKKNYIVVEDEQDIIEECTCDEIFLRKKSENEYTIIQTHKINDGYIFYGCIQQEIIGYLDIVKYDKQELPLSSLKVQDQQKKVMKDNINV